VWKAEMLEDAPSDAGGGDEGHDAEATAAVMTSQDIDGEGAHHELGPL
jgi:hypothetical protein